MSAIVTSIEVARPAHEVFAYATDPRTFPEWQRGVTRGELDSPAPQIGTRCTTVRNIGGTKREVISEITEYAPPRRWADHGISGPIRGVVSLTVEDLPVANTSRITISVDFEGHGIGRLLIPWFVRPAARKEMPANMEELKRRLEERR